MSTKQIKKHEAIVEIPKDVKNKPIHGDMKRVFTRPSFLRSLAEFEKEIHSI